jgi:hypothetical protein
MIRNELCPIHGIFGRGGEGTIIIGIVSIFVSGIDTLPEGIDPTLFNVCFRHING